MAHAQRTQTIQSLDSSDRLDGEERIAFSFVEQIL